MASVTSNDLLAAWLRDELGLEEYRRVVRENESTIVVSKFEPGFAPNLFETVDALPELFDDEAVTAEYERIAADRAARGESPLRTEVWREASLALLRRYAEQRGIDQGRQAHVVPGIESVQAVLDTILWTAPTIIDEYAPGPGESAAFQEFDSGDMERDIFTRYYGALEGKRVENYCPGSQLARRLLAQGYRICTGMRPQSSTLG